MRSAFRTGSIVVLMMALTQGACAASSKQYERRGMAGAVMVLSGTALSLTGRQLILRNHETEGVVTASTGGALQLAGVVLIVHALDGLIKPPPEYFPADRYWHDRSLQPRAPGAIVPAAPTNPDAAHDDARLDPVLGP